MVRSLRSRRQNSAFQKWHKPLQATKMIMLGEMSAGIAHELNQPLNAIKMGNEYLKMMIEKKKTIP